MPRCSSCSAPLPANSSRCDYCRTRNDMDFIELNRYALSRKESHHNCPHCLIPMQTISLSPDGSFAIERCDQCFGLFFDPGEIQTFLETSVSAAYEVNLKQIGNITRERASKDSQITYIKCPTCGKIMNRVNFGYMSGVVMDQCRKHGVWLDNGELVQLMEWKKAGGGLLVEERRKRQIRQEESARRPAPTLRANPLTQDEGNEKKVDALLHLASSLLGRLFG